MGNEEEIKLVPSDSKPRLVKPCEISIYGPVAAVDAATITSDVERSETYEFIIGGVRKARLAVQETWNQFSYVRDRTKQIVDTGIAHSTSALDVLKDEDNVVIQAGFIGGLGLVGFIVGSLSKRARFFKRLFYTGAGTGTASAICFPAAASATVHLGLDEAKRFGFIAYNFVEGVPSGTEENLKTDEVILSDDDKRSLSEMEAMEQVRDRDQSYPADEDMYTNREGRN